MRNRKILRCTLLWTTLLMLLAFACQAQDAPEDKPPDHSCTVNAGGGTVWSLGKDGDQFNRGWTINAGGGFAVTGAPKSDKGFRGLITANYMYARLNATSKALAIVGQAELPLKFVTSAHGSFSAVTLDPTVRYSFTRKFGIYASGGFGWLHRGVGFDGVNSPTLVQPTASTLERVSSSSGVFDIGGGVNYSPSFLRGAFVYAEGRIYQGAAINSTSTLVPFSAGVRW
jgi:hypothetical protein